MNIDNFKNKCESCVFMFYSCGSQEIHYLDDVSDDVVLPEPLPSDTVLWCDEYTSKEMTPREKLELICEDCGNTDLKRMFMGVCTECGGSIVEREEDYDGWTER